MLAIAGRDDEAAAGCATRCLHPARSSPCPSAGAPLGGTRRRVLASRATLPELGLVLDGLAAQHVQPSLPRLVAGEVHALPVLRSAGGRHSTPRIAALRQTPHAGTFVENLDLVNIG